MRIFITGATGFIGAALIPRLRRDGHELVAWVRGVDRARRALGEDVTLIAMDGSDAALAEAIAGCDAVINLAGAPVVGRRWTAAYRRELVDSRVALTERLMATVAPGGPRVVISGSAAGYYGDRGDEALTESSSAGSDFLATLCVDWERAATEGAPEGCRVVLLRTGVVLGIGGGALDKMLGFFKAGVGGPVGDGRQVMSWIHIDDLVGVIVAALEDTRYVGPINGAAPNPVTNRAFSKALGKALGRPAIFPVPTLGLRALFGAAAGVMVASQRALPEALINLGHAFRYPELRDALTALFGER